MVAGASCGSRRAVPRLAGASLRPGRPAPGQLTALPRRTPIRSAHGGEPYPVPGRFDRARRRCRLLPHPPGWSATDAPSDPGNPGPPFTAPFGPGGPPPRGVPAPTRRRPV